MSLFTLSAMVSLFFVLTKTPLMMAMLIVTQTAIIAFSLYTLLSTSWLSFILLMILVSAMMVIFVYVSSLASNDFIITPLPVFAYIWVLAPTALMLTSLALTNPISSDKSKLSLSDTDLAVTTLYKLYASHTSTLTMFLILYLLIALIVAAKISLTAKGALRSMSP